MINIKLQTNTAELETRDSGLGLESRLESLCCDSRLDSRLGLCDSGLDSGLAPLTRASHGRVPVESEAQPHSQAKSGKFRLIC